MHLTRLKLLGSPKLVVRSVWTPVLDFTLEPCAFNAEFQHFIPSYFAELTQRGDMGWKEAQRQDDFTENSNKYIANNASQSGNARINAKGAWHLEATRGIVSHSREPSQTVFLPPHAVTDFLRAYSNLVYLYTILGSIFVLFFISNWVGAGIALLLMCGVRALNL
jgi:hypothetical protein